MKQAIIDIGSNSMRLTVYEIHGADFKILFREKHMAGLAGYVENGIMSDEGIQRACDGLNEFKEILNSLHIENCCAFATASLRNIVNTSGAVNAIKAKTGFDIEVLSGDDEAYCGYLGAMQEIDMSSGAFVDVGGASTEVVAFENNSVLGKISFPVGSLQLYRDCVKKIMPGEGSLKRIQKKISAEIADKRVFPFGKRDMLVCVGGTARATLKIAKKVFCLPQDCNTLSPHQLYEVADLLSSGDDAASDLILKLEPDRIHTIVPGIMIIKHICNMFKPEEIVVCRYGVREGYLCQRVISTEKNTSIHKTEN